LRQFRNITIGWESPLPVCFSSLFATQDAIVIDDLGKGQTSCSVIFWSTSAQENEVSPVCSVFMICYSCWLQFTAADHIEKIVMTKTITSLKIIMLSFGKISIDINSFFCNFWKIFVNFKKNFQVKKPSN